MLRILQVVTYMGRGGLETMLMNYYRNIDRTKVQFDFLVHREFRADYDDEIESLGGKIYRAPRLNPYSAKYRKFMKNFFAEHEYTVVHSHLDCLAGIPLEFAKKAGVPVRIAHSHNANQPRDLKYPIKLLQRRKIASTSTQCFACSGEAGDWMFQGKAFTVVKNAIDLKKFEFDEDRRLAMRQKLGLENELVIGHVGRFYEQKNHEQLIDIFAEIIKQQNAKLLLVGKGPLEEKIKERVDAKGLADSVIFLGTRNDIPDLMQAFDVFVFPSIFEGLPLTLIEAQASDLPCVISDTIPNEVKLTSLVEFVSLKATPQEWAKKVLEFSERGHRRSEQLCSIRAHGYDIIDVSYKLEKWYQEAVEKY